MTTTITCRSIWIFSSQHASKPTAFVDQAQSSHAPNTRASGQNYAKQYREWRWWVGQIKRSISANRKAISAIIVSVQMIIEHCKRLKYHRRIVLVTDARGEIDGEDNPAVAKRITEEGIELTVV
jgi:hypothetical protein